MAGGRWRPGQGRTKAPFSPGVRRGESRDTGPAGKPERCCRRCRTRYIVCGSVLGNWLAAAHRPDRRKGYPEGEGVERMRTADGIGAAVELHRHSGGCDHVLVLVGEPSNSSGGRLEFHDLDGGDQRPDPVRGTWSIEQGKLVARFDTAVGEHERAELVLG